MSPSLGQERCSPIAYISGGESGVSDVSDCYSPVATLRVTGHFDVVCLKGTVCIHVTLTMKSRAVGLSRVRAPGARRGN